MKLKREVRHIETEAGRMKIIILSPNRKRETVPGILWIHGGGYMLGMADMVSFSRGRDLAERYGAVVISPEYRLAWKSHYPAALEDCYDALCYLYENAKELGVDPERIAVGGESAGGGLAAAVCLYARDQHKVKIAMQIPLYPMLDCFDTDSSRNNHGRVWNTKRNHWGWKHYLGDLHGKKNVPVYASAARETDYAGLPPCYTFVADGEPFLDETLTYVRNLNEAGVDAVADVYHGNVHAFDMLLPWKKESRKAREKLCQAYERIIMKGRREE